MEGINRYIYDYNYILTLQKRKVQGEVVGYFNLNEDKDRLFNWEEKVTDLGPIPKMVVWINLLALIGCKEPALLSHLTTNIHCELLITRYQTTDQHKVLSVFWENNT